MRENDLQEIEKLYAELAEAETIIQSLVEDLAEEKADKQRLINQAGRCCDED